MQINKLLMKVFRRFSIQFIGKFPQYRNNNFFTHGREPALLLLLIAGPSFTLLYCIDEVIAPNISLKVIGHQWYWSYEYSDYFHKK